MIVAMSGQTATIIIIIALVLFGVVVVTDDLDWFD